MCAMEIETERHILGLPEMDAQHAYLYSLFDRIEKSPAVTDVPAMKALLKELERYLLFHFASEEHLMRCYNYPGFSIHQSDHESAGNRFIKFLDDFDSAMLNPAALSIFLTGWLMEHSRLSDTEYVIWIKKCRTSLELRKEEIGGGTQI